MTQERLNHLLVVHVHKNKTHGLDLNRIGEEFAARSEHRLRILEKLHHYMSTTYRRLARVGVVT